MESYQLTNGAFVLKDGVCIPNDPSNNDWMEYQSWLSLGNIPIPVSTPSIDDLKSEKNTQINIWRLQANRGTFLHQGKTFTCDELSRSDIDGITSYVTLARSLPPSWPGGWKSADNSYLPITSVDDWRAFVASMVASGSANFAHSQMLKANLAQANTPAEIDAIQW